jgi:hypothetical protein
VDEHLAARDLGGHGLQIVHYGPALHVGQTPPVGMLSKTAAEVSSWTLVELLASHRSRLFGKPATAYVSPSRALTCEATRSGSASA